MRLSRAIIFLAASLGAAAAQAEVLTLVCPGAKQSYMIKFDTERQIFTRHIGANQQMYKIVRAQIEGPEVLVWAVSQETNGDVLAFFGSRTMVKHFYGNGSETTDRCRQI